MEKQTQKKSNKGLVKWAMALILIIVVAGGVLGVKIFLDSRETEVATENDVIDIIIETPKPKTLQIFQGNSRPIAVMLDNVGEDAWPHVGLNDAYCVYEVLVEGGLTRLMALFKGTNPVEIGPVRSARPYFIDYVMEHDAIYAHFGHTIMAQDDIDNWGINNIDGLAYDGITYWRTDRFYAPHDALTNMEKLQETVEDIGYRNTSDDKGFNYVIDDYDLEDGEGADYIDIEYSYYRNSSYEYDAQTKLYKRSCDDVAQYDAITEERYVAKNIIIQYVENYMLNDYRDIPDKGYQKLDTVGTGEGYFFTNGKYVKITWEKNSRSGKTIYYDLNGNEIKFNDGITYINIVPLNADITIESNEPATDANIIE